LIYLDNNATTTLSAEVWHEMQQLYLLQQPLNASSQHLLGQKAKALLATLRRRASCQLRCSDGEILFTSGATEALNLLIRGAPLNTRRKILACRADHKAITESVTQCAALGARVEWLPLDSCGRIMLAELERLMDADTGLLVVSWANSETGIIQDISAICAIAQRHDIPVVIDAVAAVGRIPIHLPAGRCAVVISGHKIYGPAGVGMAAISKNMPLRPLLVGGGQELKRRPGTEPIITIAGLVRALELALERLPSESIRLHELRQHFEQRLLRSTSGLFIIGESAERLCNTTCLTVPGLEGEMLVAALSMRGVCVSHGTACSAGAQELSPALIAMGLPKDWVQGSLRISMGLSTTRADVESAAALLSEVVAEQRALA